MQAADCDIKMKSNFKLLAVEDFNFQNYSNKISSLFCYFNFLPLVAPGGEVMNHNL